MDLGVGYNFVAVERDQGFLMPPDVRDWLGSGHPAWLVLDAVDQFDLSEFYASYRADGHGRAAFDPAMMLALVLFAYCDGVRSSRQIQRRCERDVAYRVITANQCPDHATIARFVARHRAAMAEVFSQVLALCAAAGMVRVGLVALDGTKLRGNASGRANRGGEQIDDLIVAEVEAMIDEAIAVDVDEDAEFGDRRGDELPDGLAERSERLRRLQAAKARLAEQAADAQASQDARRVQWAADVAAGRRVGRSPAATPPKTDRSPLVNTTDVDSRIMKTRGGFIQGYNGQVVVGAGQVIIAAEIVQSSEDSASLHPMLTAARDELDRAGVSDRIRACVADSGYGGQTNLSKPSEPILLVAVGTGRKKTDTGPPKHPAVARMARRLATPAGRALFRRRAIMVEPVFGQAKQRVGPHLATRGMPAVSTEWKLITASHNLRKLITHRGLVWA